MSIQQQQQQQDNNNKKKWDIIKTNNGKQRISQLCDRCCIKKIKCDGLPGGCTNCNKIGFFCKTTDKLTRSSFPKGYTKTLEKQVVELELENNKIKLQLENLQKEAAVSANTTSSTNNNDALFLDSVIMNDDDFFNLHQQFQQQQPLQQQQDEKQKLNDDLIQFDQFNTTNPIMEYLSLQHHISVPLSHEEDVIDELNYTHLLNKYIKPLLHKDTSTTNSILNNNKIDNMISKYFQYHNKLIPILDFKKFYNQYLNFFNKHDVENGINCDIFDDDDKCFIIKLLLMMKFNFNSCSIFNLHENFLKYQIFPFKLMSKLISQTVSFMNPTINKFEIMLMCLSYLYNFELPRLEFNGLDASEMNNWCYELLSMSLHYLNTLGLNINTDALKNNIEDKESCIHYNFIRLKLYWSFRILLRSIKINFNYVFQNLKLIQEFNKPDLLDSVVVLEKELQFTIEYLKLIKIIPINFKSLLANKLPEIEKIEVELDDWKLKFENNVSCLDNDMLTRQLLSVYFNFKILINQELSSSLIIDIGYDMLQDLLTYEFKPKVTRGRKKRNFNEMSCNSMSIEKINLIEQIDNNLLTNFEKLLINDKLSLLPLNFKYNLLISCLQNSDKIDHIYKIFEIGLMNKSNFERQILQKIEPKTTITRPIDLSKELNDIHQSFIDAIPSPTSSSSPSSELSFNMSRTSSVSTANNSSVFNMSRTPSLAMAKRNLTNTEEEEEEEEEAIEVGSLFTGQYYHHHSVRPNNKNIACDSISTNTLFKDDEDLLRLKQTVLKLTR